MPTVLGTETRFSSPAMTFFQAVNAPRLTVAPRLMDGNRSSATFHYCVEIFDLGLQHAARFHPL